MKTTNICKTKLKCKTKLNETKAWLRSSFMPSSQEMHQTDSTIPGACMEPQLKRTVS